MAAAEPNVVSDSGTADDEFPRPAGDMGIGTQRAVGNIFNGTVFVTGDLDASAGPRTEPVASIDITNAARGASESFVEPPGYEALLSVLAVPGLTTVSGPNGGALTTAAVALLNCGYEPVVEFEHGESTSGLVDAVVRSTARRQTMGIVVEYADAESLGRLSNFQLRSMATAAGRSGSAVVLVARVAASSIPNRSDHPICSVGTPDPASLVDRIVSDDETLRDRALAAATRLQPPVGPGQVHRLVDILRASPSLAPEQGAAAVDGVLNVLESWFASHPVGADVSWLAAAVTLEGTTRNRVEELSVSLTEALTGPHSADEGPRRFGQTVEEPAGILTTRPSEIRDLHGRRMATVVAVAPPHSRDRVIVELWDRLGRGYREAYLEWLHRLADDRFRTQQSAAVAAGVLLTHDPETVERRLLQPWASSDRASVRYCAAMALGVPALLGCDLRPSRVIARRWMRAAEPGLRLTALAAYGGPLGLWDPGSGGAWSLWSYLLDRPEIDPFALRSITGLVVGGAAADSARAVVLELLANAATNRRTANLAFAALPLCLRQLSDSSAISRESLEAIQRPDEAAAWQNLARLVGAALIAPHGYSNAAQGFGFLLAAAGQERIDIDLVRTLIREAKRQVAGVDRPSLGSRLERLLNAERRTDTPRARAAASVHRTFFIAAGTT